MAKKRRPARKYQDLVVWQKAMDLVAAAYEETADFPVEERYGLKQQLRRASVSIPSNIAEGQARTTRDFQHFLRMSRGSLFEVETQVLIAQRLGYLDAKSVQRLLDMSDEVSRLITGLGKSLDS